MKITPLTKNDLPIFGEWFAKEPDLLLSALKNNENLNPAKTHETYLLRLNNGEPAGWFSLVNIEPGNTAEFGFAIVDKRARWTIIKTAIYFLIAVFKIHQLKTITVKPSSERVKKMAEWAGFENNIINSGILERKWL